MDILTTTELHPLPGGELRLLGAVDTVTGAMSLLTLDGFSLLVDCGQRMGRDDDGRGVHDLALTAQAVLLTHAHTDHVGGLPELLERGFDGPILGTRVTLDIARVVIRDGIRLQGGNNRDIQRFLSRFDQLTHALPYDTPGRHVPGFNAQITLHEAGHILGSTSIEIETDSTRILFSGDLGRPGSPLLRDYNTTYRAGKPFDLVLMESTYGNRDHAATSETVEQTLEAIIHRARRDSGHILVPSFAIGRAQTLLYHLNTLIESGRIQDLPVALDSPLALKMTEIYQSGTRLFDREALDRIGHGDDPLEFDDLYAVWKGRDSRRIQTVDEMLVIAGSGMCTGGRIVGHLKALLPDPATCVLFVGYQAHGTLGREIQKWSSKPGGYVWIDDERVPIRAEVQTLSGLSAHADRRELARWLDAVPEVRSVALHHGEPDAQAAFASWYGSR